MTNFYKRITGSEIQGDGSTVVQPAGTITVDSNTNTLKLHDGTTPGGNSIGGGGLGGFGAYYNALYTNNNDDLYIAPLWDSGPGASYLKLPGDANSIGNAVVLSNQLENGAGVSIVSSNPRNGNTEYVWNFGSNGELSLPTGGNIGATKGGTMLDAGYGHGTSVTSFYSSGMYSSCVTANPDGTLSISTYGDGTGMSGQWTFGTDGKLTFPDSTVQTTAWTGNVSSLVNGASNVQITTANEAITITRGDTTYGPGQYAPPVTWTFGSGAEKTALTVPGYVQGSTGQTGFINSVNLGMSLNGTDYMSLGINDGGANVTKLYWGSASKNGILGDVEIQTINSGGTPTSIILSPQGGVHGSFVFGGTGTLTLPTGGSITFPDATVQTTAFNNTALAEYLSGNVTIGNLFVNGNSAVINVQSYTVDDNIIQIANNNPADTLDIGFVGHRTVGGQLEHTGLVRNASLNQWELFSNVVPQPGTTVDFTNAIYDNLQLGQLKADTIHLTGTAPTGPAGNPGDIAGDIHVDNNYIYRCFANWTDQHYSATSNTLYTMDGVWHINKGSYPQPQPSWTITGTSYPNTGGYTTTITGVTDEGATWGITGAGIANNGVITAQPVTFYNPVYPTIWETIPFTSFGTPAYSNANVAAYLSANPQGSTYSNANVASYLTAGISSNIKTSANVIAPNYLFANGVNILSTVSGSYGNTQVAAYLTANPPASSYGNSNVASYLTTQTFYSNANVASYLTTQTFYSNANVASYLVANPQPGTYGNTQANALLAGNIVSSINTTGTIIAGNVNVLTTLTIKDVRDTVYDLGTTSGTIAPNGANGGIQTITLTGALTLNGFTNPVSGQSMTILITQPATGGPYTLTSSMKFANANKNLSTAANAVDMLTVSYIGSTYYASLITGFA